MSFIPSPETATPGGIIRAKWMLDGAATLAEASEAAFAAAVQLRDLHRAGWTLAEPITDDYGVLVDPTGNSGNNDASEDPLT